MMVQAGTEAAYHRSTVPSKHVGLLTADICAAVLPHPTKKSPVDSLSALVQEVSHQILKTVIVSSTLRPLISLHQHYTEKGLASFETERKFNQPWSSPAELSSC